MEPPGHIYQKVASIATRCYCSKGYVVICSTGTKVHISPPSLVPKTHQANKRCMIVGLSPPPCGSVNDGIYKDLCSLAYASLDDAVRIFQQLGWDTDLVKLDIKDV